MELEEKFAKTISVFNQKGGSGKSTLSINLAVYAGMNGLKTLLIDIDDQATAQIWHSKAPIDAPPPFDVRNMAAVIPQLRTLLKQEVTKYDLIIIDCPPAINKAGPKTAMKYSDVVVIPTIPSPSDIWAMQAALELVKSIKEEDNEFLKPLILGSMVGRTKISKASMDELGETDDVVFLKSSTSNRAAYRESQLFGAGIINYPGSPKEAIAEINAVCEEILSHVFEV